MNTYLQEIINKYNEFDKYLKDIDINQFKQFSRSELNEFKKQLISLFSFRYLPSEIDEIIKEKKINEFPELLGVHHYPEIKELTCISEEDKIKLDDYLNKIGFNKYIQKNSSAWMSLTSKWSKETQDTILQFLEDKQILEKYYKLYVCHDCIYLDQEDINNYYKILKLKEKIRTLTEDEWEEYNWLEEEYSLEKCCNDCDEEYEITKEDIDDAVQNDWNNIYQIIKQRDKSLDNV